MDWISAQPLPLVFGFAALLGLLVLGSLAALILPNVKPGAADDLAPRMKSWWVICALVGGALLLGWQAFTILFAFISFIALREFLTLAPTRKEDRLVVLFVYASVLIVYWAVWIDNFAYFLVIPPVYIFIATAMLMAFLGRTDGFLATAGIMQWGVIVCVFNLGHVAFLMRTPLEEVPEAGPAGLVFFLIFVTQFNDVAQYCWGKLFGHHKISPKVSPNKTWEGAIGGFLTTTIIFVLLAPYFTPLDFWPSVIVGLVLPVAGFFGDITMSAIKRDLGVKDTSRLLPGHGGALDRLDSLMFTAPLFLHALAYYSLERF
ncbi:MAG: phosphatidate cytidylyltransferase [Henriciella sp.]|uniref:phosphatidate cytidylyltransferase n=1 Tax=Henriciella sp. TaxID=1968823 RepID=UPI003C730FDB